MSTIIQNYTYPGAGNEARTGASLLSRNWAWFVVRGGLALILGAVAIFFPLSALLAFTMVFAAYAGADGLLSTIAGVRGVTRKEERWWALVSRGIIGIAVAVLFMLMPFVATVSYALVTLGILSAWAELQIFFVMINRRRWIRLVLREQPTQFQVRSARPRIRFQNLFECLDRTLVIHGVHPATPNQKLRLFFLIRPGDSRAATQKAQAAGDGQAKTKKMLPRHHLATLYKACLGCNRRLHTSYPVR